MSGFTKDIMQGLIELLDEKPMSKVTVKRYRRRDAVSTGTRFIIIFMIFRKFVE
ncbi:MAG: hypothetical protein ACLUTA_16355 [Blautia wexlerae]